LAIRGGSTTATPASAELATVNAAGKLAIDTFSTPGVFRGVTYAWGESPVFAVFFEGVFSRLRASVDR
jgi:hypothetical protein